jgi:light-harvesting complex 1 beta chain
VAGSVTSIPAAREVRGTARSTHHQEGNQMAEAGTSRDTLTGLTEDEAKEFHRIFMQSFVIFVGVAVVAHFLAFVWRPWLFSESSVALMDSAKQLLTYVA